MLCATPSRQLLVLLVLQLMMLSVTGLASCDGGLNLDGTDITTLMNPYWVAGRVNMDNMTILKSKGRHAFTIAKSGTGFLKVTWTTAHPDGVDFLCFAQGEGEFGALWNILHNANSTNLKNTSTTVEFVVRDNSFNLIDGSFNFFVCA